MPELPEVETVMRGMEQVASCAKVLSVTLTRPDLRWPLPVELATLSDVKIKDFTRRSKYILMQCMNNKTVLFHLGMSGKILFQAPEKPRHKHDHVIFTLQTQHGEVVEMRFQDARRFGMVDYMQTMALEESFYLKKLGPEPLSPAFNARSLGDKLKNRKTAIKIALMDAHVVVGVGNIYASESLFRSRIHPTTPAGQLTQKQLSLLVETVQQVLQEAIEAGGSSLRDYVHSDGGLGYFQHRFFVYGREGKPCSHCQTPIEKIVQSNRSTYYCKKCQNNKGMDRK